MSCVRWTVRRSNGPFPLQSRKQCPCLGLHLLLGNVPHHLQELRERVSPFCRQGGEEMLRMVPGPKASCTCAHTPPGSMENGDKALRLLFSAQPHGRAQGCPLPCHQTAPIRLVLWSFINQTLFLAKFRRNSGMPPKVVESRQVFLLYFRRKAA